MPFKLLIVDDEPITRRGLRQTIYWGKHQIEFVETAMDGLDAIHKINDMGGVDLVLSDVRMPNMDGLQLASYIQQHYPKTKTMLISGYDEFAYAKKAMQSGVKDYLLKPVDIGELELKVEKLISEIEDEQQIKDELQRSEIKNAIFQQIYHTTDNNSPLQVGLNVRVYPFVCLVKDYVQQAHRYSKQDMEVFLHNIKQSIESVAVELGFEAISMYMSKGLLFTCLIQSRDREYHLEKLIEDVMKQASYYSLSFVWSDSIIAIADIKDKYSDLLKICKYFPLVGENEILFSNHKLTRPIAQNYPHDIEKELMEVLYHGEWKESDQIQSHVEKLFRYFKTNAFFLHEVKDVCTQVLNNLLKEYEGLPGIKAIHADFHYQQSIDLLLFNSYALLQRLFEQDIERIREKLDLKKVEKADWLVQQAEEYIQSYFRSAIKVQEVADVINVSANYFSTLFKQKTGDNFNEYVNRLRVEEAKSLLVNTPFKVSEISKQVGFREYKYFVHVFKKFSGLTPTNYRKLTVNE